VKKERAEEEKEDLLCPKCGKRCSNTNTLKYHIETHTPVVCPDCGKFYSSKSTLGVHRKLVHGPEDKKPHCCDVCGNRYYLKFQVFTITAT
jgi:hypothetical protein